MTPHGKNDKQEGECGDLVVDLDSELRGPRFEPHLCALEQDILTPNRTGEYPGSSGFILRPRFNGQFFFDKVGLSQKDMLM